MSETQPLFRQSNTWLHTWSGIVVGWLLYLIFFTGSLSFFREEINTWAQPELNQITQAETAAGWQNALQFLSDTAPASPQWAINLPSERQPAIELQWFDEGEEVNRRGGHRALLDPATGETIVTRETRIGDFLYRMHFDLYGMPRELARWLVGIATMAMFIGLITGIIIHKKIFKDFFLFRPHKGQRSWMDIHIVSSVLALPFHLMITFSGLLLLLYLLMPWGIQTAYNGDMRAYFEASGGRGGGSVSVTMPLPDDLTSHTSLISQTKTLMHMAETSWSRGVDSLQIVDPQGSPSIRLRQRGANSLLNRARSETLQFDTNTSVLTLEQGKPEVGFWRGFYNVVTALHLLRYADALPRWLFFLGGILGTIMVATGLLLWVEKRKQKVAKNGEWRRSFRLVQISNVAAIAGLPLATAAAFWANRLLPTTIAQRELWEIRIFFIVWLGSLLYSLFRNHRQAWIEQLALMALLFLTLPIYNLWRLPGHSLLTFSFDVVLLVMGMLALITSRKLSQRQSNVVKNVKPRSSLKRSLP
ncbi:iron-regulated membrane protein [Methylophaga frappieri]|uniref:Iron-regulated membrane protein n=1 Tax=Methylophaga frappieri (strain ATCC BAA-2434 / DSM 25690 / JAM7) TaxID=754477 RepID=I1YHW6_METFJ|nr:PepSY-associated TM helix domain-containing protein [Methylophaga frappieri]AFJ02509.1 iron-regulated membrane protein [Methylophaga frappieri]